VLTTALRLLGLGLCHQLPERSFFGGGVQLPVCARDTGIYVGFVVALAVIALIERGRRRADMPSPWVIGVAIVLLAAMGWDGVTSYAGLRETSNLLRLTTGIGAGFALALVVAPILNAQLWRGGAPGRLLGGTWEPLAWLAAMPLTFAAVYWGGPLLGVGYPLIVAACILATFSAVNLVVVALVPHFEHRAQRARDLLVPLAIALGVTLIELSLADALRILLLRLVSRV
jgi:uncharacterized membrane protein